MARAIFTDFGNFFFVIKVIFGKIWVNNRTIKFYYRSKDTSICGLMPPHSPRLEVLLKHQHAPLGILKMLRRVFLAAQEWPLNLWVFLPVYLFVRMCVGIAETDLIPWRVPMVFTFAFYVNSDCCAKMDRLASFGDLPSYRFVTRGVTYTYVVYIMLTIFTSAWDANADRWLTLVGILG